MTDLTPTDQAHYISAFDAAKKTSFVRDYVARLCRQGKVRGHRVGKNWYVDPHSLDAFIAESARAKAERFARDSAAWRFTFQATHAHSLPLIDERAAIRESALSFARATNRIAPANLAHMPIYAVSPAREFSNRLIAAVLALSMTVGTLALVDPHDALLTTNSVRDDVRSIAASVSQVNAPALATGAQDQLAAVASNPSLAFTNFGNVIADTAANIASRWSAAVDTFVFGTLRPTALARSTASAATPDATTAPSIAPPLPPARASSISFATAPTPRTVVEHTTIIDQPTIERIVQAPPQQSVVAGGITEDELSLKLNQLDNKLSSRMYSLTSANSTAITQTYAVVAQTNAIDQLNNTVINSPTITGGSISNSSISNSSIGATGLSVSAGAFLGNATSSNFFASNGTLTTALFTSATTTNFSATNFSVANQTITNSTTTNLAVSSFTSFGAPIAPYFTATSTSATSTFAGLLSVGTSSPWGAGLFTVGTTSPLLLVSNVSGNVGIGTTTPGSILAIQNVGNFVASATSTLFNGLQVPTLNTTGISTFGALALFNGGATSTTFNANSAAVGTLTATGLATFTNASTSLLSVYGPAYFGATATSTFGIDGSLTLAGVLTANGNTTLTNATTTSLFVKSQLSSPNATIGALTATSTFAVSNSASFFGTSSFGATATSSFNSAGALTLAAALGVGSGGTGWANINAGSILFGNGSSALATSSNLFWDTTDSRLGIGTNVPTYALDVSGLGHFTGLVDAANFVATSSGATSLFNGNLTANGNTTLTNATTTSLFVKSQLSASSAAFGGTATSTFGTNGSLTLASALTAPSATIGALTATSTVAVYGTASFGATATSTFGANGALTTPAIFDLGASSFANSDNFFGLTSFGATGTTTINAAGAILTPSITANTAAAYAATIGALTATTTLAVYGQASFGATATSSFSTAGALTLASALSVPSGGTASTTLSGILVGNGTAPVNTLTLPSFLSLTSSALSLGTLGTAYGGTGTSTWQTNSIPYFNGTRFTENNAAFNFDGSKLTATYASTTAITASGTGFFGLGNFTQTSGTTTIAAGQGFTIGGSQLVVQQGSGNVGVGTASPGYALDVNGNGRFSNNLFVTTANTGLYFDTGFARGISHPTGVNGLQLFSNTIPAMTWLDSGNVGIGTTSPATTLSTQGNEYTTGGLGVGVLNTVAGTLQTSGLITGVGISNSGAYTQSGTSADTFTGTPTFSNATYSALFTGGNVGIGTASPTFGNGGGLFIYKSDYPRIAFGNSTAGGSSNNAANIYMNTGNFILENDYASGNLSFSTGGVGATKMLIDTSGNLGIGTTSPATTLSVSGNTYTTGGEGIGLLNTTAGTLQTSGLLTGGTTLALNGTTGTSTIASGQGFTIGSSQLVVQQGSGNVGIGATPDTRLTVSNQTTYPSVTTGPIVHIFANDGNNTRVLIDQVGNTGQPSLDFRAAKGSTASPTALATSSAMMILNSYGYGSTGYSGVQASISSAAAETWSDTRQGTYLNFNTTAIGGTTLTERMRIADNGNLGIGTTTPRSNLAVEGSAQSDSDYGIFNYSVNGGGSSDSGLSMGYDTTNNWAWLYPRTVGVTQRPLAVFTDGVTVPSLYANTSNHVSIATTTAGFTLNVAGAGSYNSDSGTGGLALIDSTDPNKKLFMGYDNSLGTNGSGYVQAVKTLTAWTPLLLNPNGGFVGIGNTSPAATLDVSGTIRTGTGGSSPGTGLGLYFVGSGAFQSVLEGAAVTFNTGANNARTERVRIDGSGNVGIGTTTPQSFAALTLDGVGSSDATYLDLSNAAGSGRQYLLGSTGTGNGQGAGKFVIYDQTAGANRLTIDPSGNVGIGTTTPQALLDVATPSTDASNGTYPTGTWAARIFNLTDGSSQNGLLVLNRWAAAASTVFQVGGAYSGVSQDFFSINGIGTAYLQGFVGIGTTTPTTPLQVNSTASPGALPTTGTYLLTLSNDATWGSPSILFKGRIGQNTGSLEVLDTGGDAGNFVFKTASGGGALAEKVRITNGGNVGIGTTSPATTLSVSGNTYTTGGEGIGLLNTTAGTLQTSGLITGGTTLALSGTSGTTTIASGQGFTIGGSQFVVQQGSGNVGIGTAAPSSLLSVGTAFTVNSAGAVVSNSGTGQVFFTGHQLGSGYVQGASGIFQAVTDNPTGSSNTYFQGVTNGTTNFSVRADGQGYFAGNLGIGTTGPVAKLDVTGGGSAYPATSGATQSAGLITRLHDASNLVLDIGGNGIGGSWLQSTDKASLSATYPLLLNPNGGFVGIGTTTPSSAKLVIGGTGGAVGLDLATADQYASMRVIQNNASVADRNLYIGYNDAANASISFYGQGTTPQMFLQGSTGNVGIGTVTPSYLLDVISAAGVGSKIRIADTSAGGGGAINAMEVLSSRADGNGTFGGQIGAAYRREDGTAIASGATLGLLAFGGQYGTDTTFQSSKLLYPASVQGIAEGSFTASGAMPTALIFSTGSTGQALSNANNSYGTERMRINSSGNVGIGTTTPQSFAALTLDGVGSSDATYLDLSNAAGSGRQYLLGSTGTGNGQGAGKFVIYDQTAGANRLTIDPSGNVGIGTTSPATTLSTQGNEYTTGGLGVGVLNTVNGNVLAANGLRSTGTFSTDLASSAGIDETGNTMRLISWGINGTYGSYNFLAQQDTGPHGSVSRMYIDPSGNVGIGTTSPTTALQVNGVITPNADNASSLGNATYRWSAVYAANGAIQTSDARLKSNVTNLNYGLPDLLKLRPVSFTWTAQPSQGTQLGFIAQEVQPVFPETVNVGNDANHTLGLTYTEFIPVIVKSIQGIATISGIFRDNLIAWLGNTSNGIEDFLAVNGHFSNQLCVGSTCVTPAQFQAMAAAAGQTGAATSSSGQGSAPASGTAISPSSAASSSVSSATLPVLQVNGDNPATIQIGATYSDLGATITGPAADLNLGINVSVDGGATTTPAQIQIDTTAPGTHTIVYSATDQSGQSGQTTRTINVISPSGSTTTAIAAATTTTTSSATSTTATTTTP